jgi:NAD(P)-dependent dehydrogenase (short-subunit alcohol dehydrogenase family)
MTGKVCLITGGTSGIGLAAASALARMGATVVITSRDRRRGEAAVAEIQSVAGAEGVDVLPVDLSSMDAVRRSVAEFRRRHDRLDVLINNAGTIQPRYRLNAEGLEIAHAVNYFAPFLLTHLVLDLLRDNSPARIINVSSDAHRGGTLDWDALRGARGSLGFRAYAQSKLMLVLFTYELSRRLEGTGVTVNALHPGLVATRFGSQYGLLGRVSLALARPFLRSPEQGAATLIYLASSPDVAETTGRYFVDREPVRSAPQSYDREAGVRLWETTRALLGLSNDGSRIAIKT